MESDSWSRVVSSKRHQHALQPQFDMYLEFEGVDGVEDDSRACPFCGEEFDAVGMCCHIDDEHPIEAKRGVCPICEAMVGMDMLGHILMLHGSYLKVHHKRRVRRGLSPSHSMLSFLKKELREGHLQTLLGGHSHTVSANAPTDPLLSSFICNLPVVDSLEDAQPQTSEGGSVSKMESNNKESESTEPPLSDEDQAEKSRRSEFARQLVVSTIFKGPF